MLKIKRSLLLFLCLFSSGSTILCCALPIILVMLGMGAAFANLTAAFPFISWLADKSTYLFVMTIILLAISAYFIFIKPAKCPAKQELALLCRKINLVNKVTWWSALIILLLSLFFKYILILFIV